MKLRGDRCRCSGCGEYFNSTGAFDRHRVGQYPQRRCRTVAEMLAMDWSKNPAGFWIREKRPRALSGKLQERRSPSTPCHALSAGEAP